MPQPTIRDEHDREWFNPVIRVTFDYDHFDEGIPNNKMEFQLLNKSGDRMERVFRSVRSALPAEVTAIIDIMQREVQEWLRGDNYFAFPRVTPILPFVGQVLSGTVTVQIDARSDTRGDMQVEWKLNDGDWQSTVYNAGSGYYETVGVDTTPVADGTHSFAIRAQDVSATILIELAAFDITVDNS